MAYITVAALKRAIEGLEGAQIVNVGDLLDSPVVKAALAERDEIIKAFIDDGEWVRRMPRHTTCRHCDCDLNDALEGNHAPECPVGRALRIERA